MSAQQRFDQSSLVSPIVILMEDDLIHTTANPFCWQDPTCPCHEDDTLLELIMQAYTEGLSTAEEATRTVAGWHL